MVKVMRSMMNIFSIAWILHLLIFCGCGEDEEIVIYDNSGDPEECRFDSEGHFEMFSLDMEFDISLYSDAFHGGFWEFNASPAGTSCSSTSRYLYLILRDDAENDYRFALPSSVDWEEQLDILQLGKTYHFVIWIAPYWGDNVIYGLKILDNGSLIYLAVSYKMGRPPSFPGEPRGTDLEGNAFRGTDLEGLVYERLSEPKCHPRTEQYVPGEYSLVTNLPVIFRYGEWSAELCQSQEAKLTTPHGDFVMHLLRSEHIEAQNYEDGGYDGYSFYVKRL